MGFAYCVGDRIRANKSGFVVEIVGTLSSGGVPLYDLAILTGPHANKRTTKHQSLLEDVNHFTLIGGPTFTAQSPVMATPAPKALDLDDTVMAFKEQWAKTLPQCDCGAKKCGYRDDELHAHARWCTINEKTFRVPIFNKEA